MGIILIILGVLLLFRPRPFLGWGWEHPHRPPHDCCHEMHRPMGGPGGPMEHGGFGGPGPGRFY